MVIYDTKNTFQISVKEYLNSCCEGDEKVLTILPGDNMYRQTKCLFITKTGINKLSIPENSYISVLYTLDESELNDELLRYPLPKETTVFVNLPKKYFKRKTESTYPNIIFAPDHLYETKFNKRTYKCKKPEFGDKEFYKRKSLHAEKISEFINYIVRCQIVFNIFARERFVDPSDIMTKPEQKALFPFIYISEQTPYLFFEDKRGLEHDFYRQYFQNVNAKLFKLVISERERERVTFVCIEYGAYKNREGETELYSKGTIGLYNFEKIIKDDLYGQIELFNKVYGSFYIDDFVEMYKYRKFEKTRYLNPDKEGIIFGNPLIFKSKESLDIEIGSRGAFEDRIIWFSNYTQLNDPFDLLIKKPKKSSMHSDSFDNLVTNEFEQLVNDDYLTFCVTSREDNILMWSHYGYSHSGTCTSYPMIEILEAVENDNDIGICFYGNINYQPNPVPYSVPKTLMRFLGDDVVNLLFNVALMCNKYSDWEYEHEFRFLIYPNQDAGADFSKGHGVHLPFKKLYLGCNFPETQYKNYFSRMGYSYKRFKLSLTDYKLEY